MAKTTAQRRAGRTKRRELVARTGTVTGWDASVFLHAEGGRANRERKSMLALDVYGTFQEPVSNVHDFKISVFSEAEPTPGQAEIPSVGSVIAAKPTLEVVVTLADREFDVLMAVAAAGRLEQVYLCFQEPKYGSALVASCSFQTKATEGE